MCFDTDSLPPIKPIAGGAFDTREMTLTAADGVQLSAYAARATHPTGAGVIVLPDVRGLFHYYEELALRFAEHGIDSIAIDYFGRTAGLGHRHADFDYQPHVAQTRWPSLAADITAAASYLRSAEGGAVQSLFTVGFCFGGRVSWLSSTLGLDLAGVIGFYGKPVGPAANQTPSPVDAAGQMASPVQGHFGGADPGIPAGDIAAFETALTNARVDHELISYPGAPHSFFDRKAADFGEASDNAWHATLEFVRRHMARR